MLSELDQPNEGDEISFKRNEGDKKEDVNKNGMEVKKSLFAKNNRKRSDSPKLDVSKFRKVLEDKHDDEKLLYDFSKKNVVKYKDSDLMLTDKKAHKEQKLINPELSEVSKIEPDVNQKDYREILRTLEISNCLEEILQNPDFSAEIFHKHRVRKEDYLINPWNVLNSRNVIYKLGEELFSFSCIIPLILSFVAYNEQLPTFIINYLQSKRDKYILKLLKKNKMDKLSLKTKNNNDEIVPSECSSVYMNPYIGCNFPNNNTYLPYEAIPVVEMSLSMKQIMDNPTFAEDLFYKYLIRRDDFFADPWKFLEDNNIVFKIGEDLFSYECICPYLICWFAYGIILPKDLIKDLNKGRKKFLSIFRKKSPSINKIKFSGKTNIYDTHSEISKKNINSIYVGANVESSVKSSNNKSYHSSATYNKQAPSHYYVSEKDLISQISKTKRRYVPTSDELKRMHLRYGRNEINFTCRSRISGKHTLIAEIYVWESDSRIVISDVDGTITKSDLLGHILPIFGKDWSHKGVSNLFTNIEKNGYKMLYLTARPVCHANTTKNYINTLSQNEKFLPRGPILMNPDGLLASFRREIIDRTPHNFKIACLLEVLNLFPLGSSPFIAGFGNRTTDAVSYRSVGIPLNNIFIINDKGEVTQLNNSYKKSYDLLNEIVHDLFPAIHEKFGEIKEKVKEKLHIK